VCSFSKSYATVVDGPVERRSSVINWLTYEVDFYWTVM
jgi:hypothetical protein